MNKSKLFGKNNENLFQSKSTMLKLLQNNLKQSKIEKIYDFTVQEWLDNQKFILKNISQKFSNHVIVRSSAKGEDSLEQSQAGNYQSVLNANPKSEASVKNAIESVIKSYRQKGNTNNNNLILIQNQTKNIQISGVIFSRTPDIGSPYYVINYETSGATDGVTKGLVNKTIKIFRNTILENSLKNWNILLKSVREIEQLLNYTYLDIEFGITKSNKTVIFQVRPMTSINSRNAVLDSKIKKSIKECKLQFHKKNMQRNLLGDYTAFSDMADWNPAEIIGNNPNILDYSLYDFLIMDSIWHKGRSKIGYQQIKNQNLMIKFGNKPYVDIRASFNSLIPQNIKKKLKSKLISFYFQKLKKYPYLHDKVEFEILFSCYEPFLENRLNELKLFNFTNSEILILKNSLLKFTNDVIDNFKNTSKEASISIDLMKKNRTKILSKLHKSKRSYKDLLFASKSLLDDCKNLGALPFATMARLAFISSIILKSLTKNGYISEKSVENFMNSINSPLSKFQEDQIKFINKKISKKQFLNKYGHLRPGTYDINAIRYDDDTSFLRDMKSINLKPRKNNFSKIKNVKKILEKSGLNFSQIGFYDFVNKSIVQREELKFEFTRNLSDALELISEAGNKLNFSRNEISNLDLKTIFSDYRKFDKNLIIARWRKKIMNQKNKKIIFENLVLPPLIISKNDFDIILYPSAKPNFVTSKKISSNLIHINKINQSSELENKIILLENADPGFDWIFSHNLAGLITKYGGVASHMAIRCAELSLPAAIGCGEVLYEQLLRSTKIILDCDNQQIIILEHEIDDQYIEEKKILRSLGYIK